MLQNTLTFFECPICYELVSTSGNHQGCTLKCGHLFGYSCLVQSLNINSFCPICRIKTTIEDIILLYLNSIINYNEIIFENQKLKNEIFYLKNNFKLLNYEKKSNLLIEEKIIDGFRLCFSLNYFLFSTKLNNFYGIKIIKLNEFEKNKFIPLHSLQIRDISNLEGTNNIITISHDKTFSIIILNEIPIIKKNNLSETPWCCIWISQDLIAIGSTNGTIFIIDFQTCNILKKHSFGGPQFFSLIKFSQFQLILCNNKNLSIFNIKNLNFEIKNFKYSLIKKLENQNLFFAISFNSNKLDIFSLNNNNNIEIINSFEINFPNRISKFDFIEINEEIYFAIPNKQNSFILKKLSNFNKEIWNPYSNINNNSPILDIKFKKDFDLLIAYVTEDVFRLTLCSI